MIGSKDQRILRGGSFVDSYDGSFHHAAMVSTRHLNSENSAADNNGFRCIIRDTSVKAAIFDDDGNVNPNESEDSKRKTIQLENARQGGAGVIELEKEFLKKERNALKREIKRALEKEEKKRKKEAERNEKIRMEGEVKWKKEQEKRNQPHTNTKIDL